MTDDLDKARRALDAVTDLMVEDILAMSDEEITAELIADGFDPAVVAEESRQIAERAIAEADRRAALRTQDQT